VEPTFPPHVDCYLPANALWTQDILDQANTFAHSASATVTVPLDSDAIPLFLTTTTKTWQVGVHYQETHPSVSIQGEAMQTIAVLSELDARWINVYVVGGWLVVGWWLVGGWWLVVGGWWWLVVFIVGIGVHWCSLVALVALLALSTLLLNAVLIATCLHFVVLLFPCSPLDLSGAVKKQLP